MQEDNFYFPILNDIDNMRWHPGPSDAICETPINCNRAWRHPKTFTHTALLCT